MKRAITIFLLCLYTLSAFGATVHLHYCMGRLISFSLLPAGQKVCGNCGMPKAKSHGCCRDEQRTIKMGADHKLAPAAVAPVVFQPAVAAPFIYWAKAGAQLSVNMQQVSHAPPIYSPQRLYLQNRVLLI